jgi:hypothetical protein
MTQEQVERVGPEDRAVPAHPWVPRLAGLILVVALLAVTAMAYLVSAPPQPRPASAPPGEFSADRAFVHVERIAARPHPVGSPANAAVRDYIMSELAELGLQTRVLPATTARGSELARVENIHARIPGRASTGHVVAVAHYDSVAQTPGAADDAAGVAAILEAARALRSRPPLRNDIDLVITDGEEPGLLGAHAFVTADVIDADRSVVINLEARGSSGPSMLFQTSPGNSELAKAYAALEDPVGGSELSTLFEALPNDTDFTEFRRAGFRGFNLAFGDGYVNYHSPADTPANLDRSSLQHHGANLLALARIFGDQQLPLRPSYEATFSSVFDQVVWYPERLAVPLALLALGLYGAAVWLAHRHGLRLLRIVVAVATVPLMLAVVAGIGTAAWWLLGTLRPAYRSLDWGTTYRPEWYEAGLTVFAIMVAVAWYAALRRRLDKLEISLGVLAWLVLFAVALAFLAPGAAYLFTWPALVGAVGLAGGLRFDRPGSAWPAVGGATAAFPAVVLWLPNYSLGLTWAAAPMTMVALLAATVMPAADPLLPRRAFIVPAVGFLGALALMISGFRIDVIDEKHPAQTSLAYAFDADSGTAAWLSADPVLAPWTKQYATAQRSDIGEQFPGPLGRARHTGPAPAAPVQSLQVTLIDIRQQGDSRVAHLRIVPGGARRLDVAAATGGEHITATVQGVPVHGEPPRPRTERWDWGFTFEAVPAEGIDVTLTIPGNTRLPMRLLAYHDGLPGDALTSQPQDLTWSRRLPHATVVATTRYV